MKRVSGNTGCTANDILTAQTLYSGSFIQEVQNTETFYTSLNGSVFQGLPIDILNYGNAWDLYDYALFEYNHNSTIFNNSDFTAADLEILYSLASAQQLKFNTPSGGTTIQAMAGRTLASKVLEQFSHNIDSSGSADKLTLLFGSFEPFLAFFSLSDLATGPSAGSFNSLPLHGSTMTFELFSMHATPPANGNLSAPFPDISDLQVRFLYRNGTAESDTLIEYALFGNGNEAEMTWTDFVYGMGEFSLNDLVDWCIECNTASLFCEALEDNQITNSSSSSSNGKSSGTSGITPVVGGVIGAAVTTALMIILAAALLLFGFRLEQRERNAKGGDLGVLKRSGSGNGGFKGAERLESDTDLRLKGGAGATVVRHERVGSWELNESPTDRKHASLDKEIESGGISSTMDYRRHSEDHGLGNVNPFGDPVKPLDQV